MHEQHVYPRTAPCRHCERNEDAASYEATATASSAPPAFVSSDMPAANAASAANAANAVHADHTASVANAATSAKIPIHKIQYDAAVGFGISVEDSSLW